MPDNDPLRPDDGSRWARLSKTAAFWILMVLMFVVALQLVRGPAETAATFSYTELEAQLAAGNVHKVTFRGRTLHGELRATVQREGQDVTTFTTVLPVGAEDGLSARLNQAGVIVEAEADQPGWGTYLLGALPWLLFIAFWLWIFRTMQGGGTGRSSSAAPRPSSSAPTRRR